ncbi:MAG: DEAD/DEAH box helicase [Actinobacteria bacterium]|nr:DEAD/DEAH box helicase [Actinomycetota bacterium]
MSVEHRLPVLKAQVRPLKVRRRIRPDPFQVRALEAALTSRDVLVAAPTGSGKTWIAEKVAEQAVEDGLGVVYASPLKALSNQRFKEFSKRFGESAVGIVTGDVALNPQAPILIVTTEIFRNKCVYSPRDLDSTRWVVIDEFHLLDSDRGTAWEESVIFAPEHVNLVCLSATMPNCDEIGRWLEHVRGRPVEVVVEERRPVPLTWRWFLGTRALTARTVPAVLERLVEQKEEARFRRWSRRFEYDDEMWEPEADDEF